MRSTFSFLTALLLLAGAARVAAQMVPATPPRAAVVKLESGVSYSRGDYGLTQDTEVFSIPVNFSYESGSWVWRATVPWITIKGPANVIGDGAGAGAGPVRPTNASESGIGDSSVSLTYKSNPGADGLHFDVTGRVKFPTGDDDRGIGTGEYDYYAQLDLYQSFGTVTPFGTVGYRWLGDGRYQLENGFYASGGLLFTVAPGTSVGGAVEWRSKLVTGGDNATEGSVFVFQRFNDHWNGSLSVMKGFTDASANFGVSATVGYTF